jgi:hypothetical protein
MSYKTAEDADKDATTEGELIRSDNEEPPEEGTEQRGGESSGQRE